MEQRHSDATKVNARADIYALAVFFMNSSPESRRRAPTYRH